ncbi:hypothetical protein LAZ67_17001987 [Cordylochernes scorpioides]|uniref:Uncharacterized protein n=1 Tax=Cordylochernes scorpioides TaxID=51811 RepID=A0ABY6LEM9_9ARAC|nr:hypothetical protein LAZ67_17001987 [Cordylochernes scorpioides]
MKEKELKFLKCRHRERYSECHGQIKGQIFQFRQEHNDEIGQDYERDFSLDKNLIVEALVFSVVTYECEHWTFRKEERKIIEAFEIILNLLRTQNESKWIRKDIDNRMRVVVAGERQVGGSREGVGLAEGRGRAWEGLPSWLGSWEGAWRDQGAGLSPPLLLLLTSSVPPPSQGCTGLGESRTLGRGQGWLWDHRGHKGLGELLARAHHHC